MYDTMKAESDTSTATAEPSAKEQLEGNLGDVDKLVILLSALKSMIPPSPSPGPMAGPPSPGLGPGPMPMGSLMGGTPPPPAPMAAPPLPAPLPMAGMQQAPSQALNRMTMNASGLV